MKTKCCYLLGCGLGLIVLTGCANTPSWGGSYRQPSPEQIANALKYPVQPVPPQGPVTAAQ